MRPCLVSRRKVFFCVIAFLFVFGNYYPTLIRFKIFVSQIKLQTNCIINYYVYVYLMFYACAVRFDVTRNIEKL